MKNFIFRLLVLFYFLIFFISLNNSSNIIIPNNNNNNNNNNVSIVNTNSSINNYDNNNNNNSISSNNERIKVFIVHGHNYIVREKVSKFLFEMGFEPVLLFEKPNNGQTIIEKLEKEISNCKFGIVIMSPDNKAYTKKDLNSDYVEIAYPRLNVIFEFGYLIGKFGRSNVIYLSVPYNGKSQNYDLPSDLLGYVWINYTEDLKELENEINFGNYRKL
ncbi:hypothetical protein ACTFIY_000936 [Dictyostelium cf. discoideum]